MAAEGDSSACSGAAARDAFFHSSVNITEWMKRRVAETVEARGYTVVLMRADAEVMTRMSQVTVINSVTVHFRKGDGDIFVLDGYSSVNKEYDRAKNTRWLVDALKEIEMEAILKFGGKALRTQTGPEYVPRSVDVRAAEVRDREDLKVEYYFTSTVAEMARFFSDSDCIARWTLGRASFGAEGIAFGGVTIRNVRAQEKGSCSTVTMDYKWDAWRDFSSVSIELSQIGQNVRLVLVQKGIPLGSADAVKRHWHEQVLIPISQFFRCPMKEL